MNRNFALSIFFNFFCLTFFGQNFNEKYTHHVSTKDSIISTLYTVISGDKTEERNWELFRYLFKEDARLISTSRTKEGDSDLSFMTVDQYIDTADYFFKQNNFFEREIFRKTESFGSLTHIFSTYETLRDKNSEEPQARGINSIQLFNDENRWWIVNIYWSSESQNNPIPEKYLPDN